MIYDNYLNTVRQQLNIPRPELWNFKSNFEYRGILEHVSLDQGIQYLNLASQKVDLNDFIEIFAKNDLYGKPIKENLGFSGFESVSPTNARYLHHALLIKEHYEKYNTKNIIEIGGGYGGLCIFLKSLIDCNYSIFDLPEVMNLQEKYLSAHKVSCNFLDFTSELPEDFFLVSNYCYSELLDCGTDRNVVENYKKIIDRSVGGFMLWNASLDTRDALIEETFGNKINIVSKTENPLTAPQNLEICW